MIYFLFATDLFDPEKVKLAYSADLSDNVKMNEVNTDIKNLTSVMAYSVKYEIKAALAKIYNERKKSSIISYGHQQEEKTIEAFIMAAYTNYSVEQFCGLLQKTVLGAFKAIVPPVGAFYYSRYQKTVKKVENYVNKLLADPSIYRPVNEVVNQQKKSEFYHFTSP